MGDEETNKSYDLLPGDIVIDIKNKEVGFLIRRFSLVEEIFFGNHFYPAINAWDILWTGPHLSGEARRPEAYTEAGLISMLNNGALVLLRDI